MSNGKKLKKDMEKGGGKKKNKSTKGGAKKYTRYTEKDNEFLQMMNEDGTFTIPDHKNREYDAYNSLLMNTMHGEKTRGSILEMLASDDPKNSVPAAALMINQSVERQLQQRGKTVGNDVKASGAASMVQDLAEMGKLSGFWERDIQEDEVPLMVEDTMKKYIHAGLKDGTIDPIDLQLKTELLMTDNQHQEAMGASEKIGLSAEPTQGMATNMIVDNSLRKEREGVAQMDARKETLANEQQMAQQQQQGQQGQGQQQGQQQQMRQPVAQPQQGQPGALMSEEDKRRRMGGTV